MSRPTFNFPRLGGFRGGRRATGYRTRLLIALVVAVISIISYYQSTRKEYNEVTGEMQRVALAVDEEIAMGLHAAPEMARHYGGEHADPQKTALVRSVGRRLVEQTDSGKTGYPFDFHLLADEQTVNAFALPGGQVFMTAGLFDLLGSEEEVAGVLGHEIGHVVARHAAEQIAQAKLSDGLTRAAILAVYDPEHPHAGAAQMAAMVGQLINTKYSRSDELESDQLGVRFLIRSGYDPEALIGVMKVLAKAAEGGQRVPEFMSTHPNPENRIEHIREAIQHYQNGH